MPRTARLVVPGYPHHVTQRGNRRQPTFFGQADYAAYLHIAAEAFRAALARVMENADGADPGPDGVAGAGRQHPERHPNRWRQLDRQVPQDLVDH